MASEEPSQIKGFRTLRLSVIFVIQDRQSNEDIYYLIAISVQNRAFTPLMADKNDWHDINPKSLVECGFSMAG